MQSVAEICNVSYSEWPVKLQYGLNNVDDISA